MIKGSVLVCAKLHTGWGVAERGRRKEGILQAGTGWDVNE